MIRVHVICEGQTEEMFVNDMLQPILQPKEIFLIPSLLGKPGHKGGNVKIERVINDVRMRLLGDKTSYCTLLIDFYGISPKFPGYEEATHLNQHDAKSQTLLQKMCDAIEAVVGHEAMRRFIPYVQMYEFEALLFSDPRAFAASIGRPNLAERFATIRSEVGCPEEINDGLFTAPSKRIQGAFPEFEKPIHGTFGALEIGIDKIRTECPLFSNWLSAIESLPDREPLS